VRPVWQKIFALPVTEVYADWGAPAAGPPYLTIRRAPPVQWFSDEEDNFNSRMLPLLMAGAVVGNAYEAVTVPWMRALGGSVVENLPESAYRLRNHELELWGEFRPGQEIKTHLRHLESYWRVADPECARIRDDDGEIGLVMLKPCGYVAISIRPGFETAGWVVSAIGLAMTAAMLWRKS
jgi:hypothetical protein